LKTVLKSEDCPFAGDGFGRNRMKRHLRVVLGILVTSASQFGLACGGDDASALVNTATSSGTGGSDTTGSAGAATTTSSGAGGDSNGAGGASTVATTATSGAGGSNGSGGPSSGTAGTGVGPGGASGSGGQSVADASGGTGGGSKDASAGGTGGATRDAGADRGCVPSDADRCDNCTASRCCVELDTCEANAACKDGYAAIDACIGDSGRANRERACYTQFGMTDQRAKNLADCVVANCMNQCNL
jgi:hypothetical protein